MIDSGASSDFLDAAFARRCGFKLSPSKCTIRLADGTVVPALGQVEVRFDLNGAPGQPSIPFVETFTVTPLKGYDLIFGLSWLTTHDVIVGYRNRTIEIRTAGRPMRCIKPLECIGDAPSATVLATITVNGLAKAHRRGQVEEIYAIFVQPKQDNSASVDAPRPTRLRRRDSPSCWSSTLMSSPTSCRTGCHRLKACNTASNSSLVPCRRRLVRCTTRVRRISPYSRNTLGR